MGVGRGRWAVAGALALAWLAGCGEAPGSSGTGSLQGPDGGAPGDAGSPGPGPADGGVSPEPADGGAPADAGAGPVAARCGPTAGDDLWVLEGERVEATARCALGLALDPSEFSVVDLPPGAAWDARSATLTWTPGRDQAATWRIGIEVQSLRERGTLRVGVVEDWASRSNTRIVDPLAYPEEYGLPVLHVTTAGGVGHVYAPATLVYGGRARAVEIKYRGATSLQYPKRSYTLKFPEDDRFADPARGIPPRRRMVLTTTFDDLSYVRQRLAFDLWNRLGPRVTVRTTTAVLYLDGRYRGLYTLGDHIDRHLLDDQGLQKEGDLYKAVSMDANFDEVADDGSPKSPLHLGFEKKEGTPAHGERGAYAPLEDLIRFVAGAPPGVFAAEAAQRLALDDYERWWALVMFTLANDSTSKNAYHHRDTLGGPWTVVPWDFNASFGQDYFARRQRPTTLGEFGSRNLLWRRLLEEPADPPIRARLAEALRGAWALPAVLELYDGYLRDIDRAARRDELRWVSSYRSYFEQPDATYDDETRYVRGWLEERWRVLERAYPR